MNFFRCQTALTRTVISSPLAARVPRWVPVRHLQTRDSRIRAQKEQVPPSQSPSPPSTQTQPNPILDETQYTLNANEHKTYFQEDPELNEVPEVKVKFLAPAIWALTVSTGIYISLAYLTARQEVEEVGIYKPSGANWVPSRQSSSSPYTNRGPPTFTEVASRAWSQTDPMSKLSWSLIGFNGAVHLSKFVTRDAWYKLWHVPVTNRNYTLLTSTFVHSGPAHLGFNMFAMYQFLPAVGQSGLFSGDTNHVLSFYLATGIMASYAQHAASTIFKRGRPYSACK